MLKLDAAICTDFAKASSREWLETNGVGGFACGTIAGANTRRYHSFLTAATTPPLGRLTLIGKVEETLLLNGREFELSSNQYPGTVHPLGFQFLENFRLDPFPVWTFEVNGVRLEKAVFMVHGQNSTVCRWKLLEKAGPALLKVRPLLSFVDYHHLQREVGGVRFESQQIDSTCVSIVSNTGIQAYLNHNASSVETTGHWYREFQLAIEKERGFDFSEDLFQPFELSFDLSKPAAIIASDAPRSINEVLDLENAEIDRREKLLGNVSNRDEFSDQLALAADQFVVRRGEGYTILAGYPWFSDWGRDTMIALNGLTLAAGRPNIARDILLEFSKHISQGMLPNRFGDEGGEADYNTVDATLWYFEAVRAFLENTSDGDFVRDHVYGPLTEIIGWHIRGTRFAISLDTDGLLHAGEIGIQLTWMDAKIGDKVITPRIGKPVEIQALWYNALCIIADLSKRFGKAADASHYLAMAERCRKSFNEKFWNDEANCLFDVVNDEGPEASIRPNQIFAASLPFTMLSAERSKAVVDKVEAELLTPFGLRSLSASDPNYVPIYTGSPLERDSAYHQGTVWAWLIGPFVDAYVRTYPDRADRVSEFLAGFRSHLFEAGIGQISEIFDAEAPHRPRGCFAQAWSIAEVFRIVNSGSKRPKTRP